MIEQLQKLLLKETFDDIIGQEDIKEQLKSALLSRRHIVIVGPPGIGKTTLAKNVAKLLPEIEVNNCEFNCSIDEPICPNCRQEKKKTKISKGFQRFIRIQGSPDLTVEDLIGDIDPAKALKFGPQSVEAFTPGKIFRANNGILFFDELNRCPEKVQNSLLQVLEEGKATVGSYNIDLPSSFIFIGTMNPEDSSTEPLSDVFVDRFDMIYMSYPENLENEVAIVDKKAEKLDITFPEELEQVTIGFVRLLRENKHIEKKPSVRASIGLIERACANTLIDKRRQATLDDVRKVMISVLAHRIRLKPSHRYVTTNTDFLRQEFGSYTQTYSEEKEGDVP